VRLFVSFAILNKAQRKPFKSTSKICFRVELQIEDARAIFINSGQQENATFLVAGDMGVHTLSEETGTSFEDWTMDDEDWSRRRGQRVAAANAGGLAGGWSSGTRGPNSG